MPFIDIHTHTTNQPNNVLALVNYSIGMDAAQPADNVWYTAGLHPWYAEESAAIWSQLEAQIMRPNCLAIGECGLDKIRGVDWETQLHRFKAHILLSEKVKKPLILHVVKAFDTILQLKKDFQPKQAWIVHGFDKHPETAQQLVKQGIHLSLGTRLMHQKQRLLAIWEAIDASMVFLETDTAEIAIDSVYTAVSEAVGLPLEELKALQNDNFKRLFGNTPIDSHSKNRIT